jgi:hypothetical protein
VCSGVWVDGGVLAWPFCGGNLRMRGWVLQKGARGMLEEIDKIEIE